MAWLASVRTTTGFTRHRVLRGPGEPAEDIAAVVRVVIYAADGGYYLLRYSAADVVVANTWHESLEQAKDQARYEYLVEERDWQIAPVPLETINPHSASSGGAAKGF
jgi:hypothetical protein